VRKDNDEKREENYQSSKTWRFFAIFAVKIQK
jgi:hypothetical protein